jgi:hypothetical protein
MSAAKIKETSSSFGRCGLFKSNFCLSFGCLTWSFEHRRLEIRFIDNEHQRLDNKYIFHNKPNLEILTYAKKTTIFPHLLVCLEYLDIDSLYMQSEEC